MTVTTCSRPCQACCIKAASARRLRCAGGAESHVLLPPMLGPVSSSARAGEAHEPSTRSLATMQPPGGARAHGCHTWTGKISYLCGSPRPQ